MNPRNITLILVLAISSLAASSPAESQDRAGDVDVPAPFQVFSFDGKQSLKAACRPKTSEVITCNLILVKFFRPDEMAAQEEKSKNSKKSREEKAMEEEMGKAFCSSEVKTAFERKMLDPQIGPKTRKYSQEMVEACSAKDPQVFLDSLSRVTKRTCGLLVEPFSLDFKKTGKGQWLSNPGPQGVCNVVRTYVLRRDEKNDFAGSLWTITETMVARGVESPLCKPPFDSDKNQELNKPFVWSWNNYNAFELPSCDFIAPTHVLPDIPRLP
jgi:hypothetical protein